MERWRLFEPAGIVHWDCGVMQCWPHPTVEAAEADATGLDCTVLGTEITTMTVHNRKKKFSHKVENIGTIYQRLKV